MPLCPALPSALALALCCPLQGVFLFACLSFAAVALSLLLLLLKKTACCPLLVLNCLCRRLRVLSLSSRFFSCKKLCRRSSLVLLASADGRSSSASPITNRLPLPTLPPTVHGLSSSSSCDVERISSLHGQNGYNLLTWLFVVLAVPQSSNVM